jgi:HSP20 family protein
MTIKDLVPKFGRHRGEVPARRMDDDPFHEFQRDINRLFDEFFGDFGLPARSARRLPRRREEDAWGGAFAPKVDVSETDKDVTVSAELPGMDEKDITVEMDDDSVTIRGERRDESEDKGKNWYRREQTYGSFHRVVPLPGTVDGSRAAAKFKKGVLTVKAPKRELDRADRKTIAIESD